VTDRTIIIVACVTTLPPTLVGLGALVTAALGRRDAKAMHGETKQELHTVKVEINGRMTELLKTAVAQGRQDERDAQK
jgi:hypothetical protein